MSHKQRIPIWRKDQKLERLSDRIDANKDYITQMEFPMRLEPTGAEIRQEVQARLIGLELRQQMRDEKRKRLAAKRRRHGKAR